MNAREKTNARRTAEKRATALQNLLTRIQAATAALPQQAQIHWGHAGQLEDATRYAVYAAFSLGVVNEREARELGFPV